MIQLNKRDREIILRACTIGTTVIMVTEDRNLNVISRDNSVIYMDILDAKETATNIKKIVIDNKMAAVIKCMTGEFVYIIKENDKILIKDENIESAFKEIECDYTAPTDDIKSIALIDINSIKRVLYSAAQTDSMRPVLEGINFIFKGNTLEVATTDGFRGSHLNLEAKTVQGELDCNFTIAKTDIQKVLSIFAGEIMVCIGDKKVYFMGNATTIVTSRLDDKYIDYLNLEKVLVTNCNIGVKKAELLNAINICAITSENGVKLHLTENEVYCTGVSSTSNTKVLLAVSNREGLGEIVFNPKYVADMLNSLSSEEINIRLGVDGCKVIKVSEEDYSSFTIGIAEQQ